MTMPYLLTQPHLLSLTESQILSELNAIAHIDRLTTEDREYSIKLTDRLSTIRSLNLIRDAGGYAAYAKAAAISGEPGVFSRLGGPTSGKISRHQ